MILKMAYERDPELQKLRRITYGANITTAGMLSAAAGGTLAQVTTNIAIYNPPDGVPESCAPGIIGVALEGATNAVLLANLGAKRALRRKVRKRQFAIAQRAENVLHHLEYSDGDCLDAQKELAELVGDRAASEYMDLWHSSHVQTASTNHSISMVPKIELKTLTAAVPSYSR